MLELIFHLNYHKVILIAYTISYLHNLSIPHMDPTIWLWYLTINHLVMYSITSYGYHLWLWYLPISSSRVKYPYSSWIQPYLYGYLAISLRQLTFAIEIAIKHQNLAKTSLANMVMVLPILLWKQHSFLVHLLWCKRYGYQNLPCSFLSVFPYLISLVYGHQLLP